jgi:DNA polymerase III delta subunit
MIIFLYGPDDYRRVQKKKDIIMEFGKKRSGLGLGIFDLNEKGTIDVLGAFLQNQPIFETARLAVLENAFEIPPEKLAAILKPVVAEKSLQVLIAEHDKPLKALAFLLEKPVLSQKFETLGPAEFIEFLMIEGKKRGAALSASAAQFLAAVYAGNSWAAITELEKLSSFMMAKTGVQANRVLERRDLDALDLETAPNYWALLNRIKSFDIRNRLSALETLFSINDPAAKIFNIVSAQAGEKLPRMAEYDLAVKSGKLEYEEALVDFVLG